MFETMNNHQIAGSRSLVIGVLMTAFLFECPDVKGQHALNVNSDNLKEYLQSEFHEVSAKKTRKKILLSWKLNTSD